MSVKENEIIDYEEIFKDETDPEVKFNTDKKSVYALIVYFILFISSIGIILASFISGLFVKPFKDAASNNDFVATQVMNNDNYVGLINENSLDLLNYENIISVMVITIDDINYEVIINVEQDENIAWLQTEISNQQAFEAFIKLDSKVNWPNDESVVQLIILQQSDLQTNYNELLANSKTVIILANYNNLFMALLQAIIYLIAGAILIYLFRKELSYEYLALKDNYQTSSRQIFGGLGLMLLVAIGSNMLLLLMQKLAGIDGQAINQAAIESGFSGSALSIVLMILSVVILAPIVEELVFRKALFSIIKNPIIAIATSSLLFSAMHILSEPSILHVVVNIIPYLSMGVFLGWYYHYKADRNVVTLIFLHALNNLIGVISILFL